MKKWKEEYTKTGLDINFSKTEYLTTRENNLEIEEARITKQPINLNSCGA